MTRVHRCETGFCFLAVLFQICANTVNAVTYQLSLCIFEKCGVKAMEDYQHIPDNHILFTPVNRELLYKIVCFPTVSLFCRLPGIEQSPSTYQHAKKQKELARQTSFDPILRSKITQKIVLCSFAY